MEYGSQHIVRRPLTKVEREQVQIPEESRKAVERYYKAMQIHVPRTPGKHPERLVFMRPDGTVTYPGREAGEAGLEAVQTAINALALPVSKPELVPCPNPEGGSPWYQIYSYLLAPGSKGAGKRQRKAVNWQAM